jgi:DNA-binding transcriptional MocR family regulator
MTLYEQLAEEVRRAIRGGVYTDGEKLPSIRDISRDKDLSINTVLKAYSVLEQEGWVSACAKSGYFVQKHLEHSEIQDVLGEPWSGKFEDLMPVFLEHTQQSDVLNLGLAQPESDLIPHELIAKTMRSVLRDRGPEIFGYCDPAGIWELRKQIVLLMSGVGLNTDMSNVIVTNGCQEAISVAFQIVTNPGDIVVVESPCYCGALQALSSLGLRILEIPSTSEHGIRQDLLQKTASKYRIAACYVMTGVSNPTGGSMTRQDMESLCELADSYGFPIIEDFTNGDLADSKEGRRPLKAYDKSDNIILCSSFSKTLTPGLRTGWLIAGQHQAEALKLKYGSSLNVSALNQLTVSRLISAGNYRRHLARSRPLHSQTLRVLRNTVEKLFPADSKISMPKGGFCLWVQLPKGYNSMKISHTCMQRHVVFAPGQIFSVDRDYSNYLRIGWGGQWNRTVANGVGIVASVISQSSKTR